MSEGEAPDPYFQSIEEEFVRRRGAAMLLSPKDWALIDAWKAEGIPLRVVLQAIRNVFEAFDRRAPKGRRINSLSYCRQEVASLHEIDLTVHAVEAGRPPGAAPDASGTVAVVRHLGRLQRSARAALLAASEARRDRLVGRLAVAASELKRLRKEIRAGGFDPRGLEDTLRRLDDDLLDGARAALPPEELARLAARAEADAGPALGRMTREARDRTRRLHEGRLIREACLLPRLTLFD